MSVALGKRFDILNGLNEAQYRAVTTTEGPLLVLAGAGTGKTRVVTLRIAFLIRQGVPPASILALTFSRKAACEMKERIRDLLGPKAWGVTACTFHALGLRLLREQNGRSGFNGEVTIITEHDRREIVRSFFAECDLNDDTCDLLLSLISRAKNAGGSAQHAQGSLEPITARLYAHYEGELEKAGAVDFDDMILRPLRLLEGSSEFATRCRTRWRYIIVDEYQDTNRTQYRLIQHLLGPEKNLCVVGDDDQSIYGFRGAEADRILRFAEEFAGAATVKLEINYRSHTPIIALANAVISQAAHRFPKQLTAQLGPGPRVEWQCVEDQNAEIDHLATRIKKSAASGIPLNDMAILMRLKKDGQRIQSRLKQQGIPCTAGHGSESQDDAVHVMTLHQSKGLEFPLVFLPAIEENKLPHFNALLRDGVEEERRLLYVGVTRARERLVLTSCRSRNGWRCRPSRFLTEVDRGDFLVVRE